MVHGMGRIIVTHVQHLVPMQFEPQMADIQASSLQLVQFAKLLITILII